MSQDLSARPGAVKLEIMRHITDAERRARIAVRHGIAPATRLPDAVSATRAMTVLHATEHPSIYLSLHARVDDLTVDDVDRELYEARTLVKQLAMRRTLFVFPRELLPAALGSASARVAELEWRRLAKDVETSGLASDGSAWLEAACGAVLARLAGGEELSAQQLREQVPQVQATVTIAPGKRWGGDIPVGPRVLTQLGARGDIVRGRNAGHWRSSRPTWTLMSTWLDEVPQPLSSEEGYAELVRRWLGRFGPGTEADLVWWLGATKSAVRRALADVGAAEVVLDGDTVGRVLPDDLEPVSYEEPWVALLPVLDPTTMGWKDRHFYLGVYGPQLFDSNGNAGTTAWSDGRIVGCWVQDEYGVVRVVLLEDPGEDARGALEAEAERLTAWLDGLRVSTIYPSTAMRRP